MPNFRIETPDGKSYRVEAPDAASAAAAIDHMMQAAPAQSAAPAPPAGPGVLEDSLKAAGSGLVTGAVDLAGMGGDVENLVKQGAHWADKGVRSLIGAPPPAELYQGTSLPTSADVEKFTGWDKAKYQPQTTTGKIVGAAAEFVPGAATMGGGLIKAGIKGAGALAAKAGENALKYGVAPGVASEGAGQVLDNAGGRLPQLAPYARLAGGVAGLGAASLVTGGAKKVASLASADMKAAAKVTREAVDANPVMLKADSFRTAVDDLTTSLTKARINPQLHPDALAALGELKKVAASGADITIEDVESLRQIAKDVAENPLPREKFMSGVIVSKIDHYLENLKPNDIISGDANKALDDLIKFRSQWHKFRKLEALEGIVDRAKRAMGTQGSSASFSKQLRLQFKTLANNDAKFKMMFRPDERKAIESIIRGDKIDPVIKLIGNLDPRSPLIATLGVLGGLGTGHPLIAAALGGAGYVAKKAAEQIDKQKVNSLKDLVISGKIPKKPASMAAPLGAFYGTKVAPREPTQVEINPKMIRDRNGNLVLAPNQ